MFITYDMSIFAENIKSIRRNLRLTQNDVYEATGIHTDTIRRIEKGENIPNYETIEKLSLFYGIDLLNVLSHSKTDVTLKDLYDGIDEVILNNNSNLIEQLENMVEKFRLNSKLSNMVKPELLQQYNYFLKLLRIFSEKNSYTPSDLTSQFEDCLELTTSQVIRKKKSVKLSNLELRINLIIALLKVEQRNYEASNIILLWNIDSLSSRKIFSDQDHKIYIKCLCNLAYNYHDLFMHDKVIEVANDGIEYCKKNNLTYLLYLLYARRAIAKKFLFESDYLQDIFNSICLLDILGLSDLKFQYIEIYKTEYNIDIKKLLTV